MPSFSPANRRLLIFGIVYTIVFVSSFNLSRSDIVESNPKLLWAVLFDLTILPVLLFYFVVERVLTFSKIRIILVFAFLVRLGFYVLPGHINFPGINLGLIVGLIEVGGLVLIGLRFRFIRTLFLQHRVFQPFDHALRASLASEVGPVFADVVMTEFRLIQYSLFGWLVKNDVAITQNAITSYKKSALTAVLVSILVIGLTETAALHLLITR